MRAIACGAVVAVMGASLLGVADCRPATSASSAPGAAAPPAAGVSAGAVHLRVAALVPKAPVTLTTSDGRGLGMASLAAHAVLVGPLAFTELRLVFTNPEPRTTEGTFAVTLPPRASISRFAMRIGDAWQEGEVVEKQRAREAFEDFLHRKRDPALLEQAAGNQFRARVFPIPAGSTKEILLSYSQELAGDEPYVLPLRGLPEVGALELSAIAEGSNLPLATRRETRWAPDEDFRVDRAALARVDGLRSGDLVVARVRPVVDARPDPVRSAIVLVDTSASAALELDRRARQLGDIAAGIATGSPGATLTVACFDQQVAEAYSGPASGFGAAQADAVRGRAALGASDLARALRWARDRAAAVHATRVVLLSDGVATAGATYRADLVAAARALGEAGVERLDALATGGVRDDGVLSALAHAGLSRDGVVIDADADAGEAVRRLGSATRSHVAVRVDGASWSHPRTIDGVQPGDEVLVYAQIPPGAPVTVAVDGSAPQRPELRPVERPLLERASTQARIASLLDREGAEVNPETTRAEIVALSTSRRVLSPYTAMLVLETEGDYARFHLDRSALADVLEVQGSRVALTHRGGAVIPPVGATKREVAAQLAEASQFGTIGLLAGDAPDPSAPTAPWGRDDSSASAEGHLFGGAIGDSFGSGGLGLAGMGEGAGGRGHVVRSPAIRMGATTVSGRLPPEIIQRIVRQSFGRFRACYEEALRRRPGVQGQVTTRFVIGRAGDVLSAQDGGSDVNDAALVACVVRAFGTLTFPQPEGTITVSYPIRFSPEGSATDGSPTFVATSLSTGGAPGRPRAPAEPPPGGEPYSGRFAEVMQALAAHDARHALDLAWAWRDEDAGDVLALVALGEALEEAGDRSTAARAYGSIVDLFPSSADMRRMAGERLDRLPDADAAGLAADDYAKTVADRPDHPSSHRLLAYALLRQKDYAGAFDAAVAGLAHRYPDGRYPGVDRILREDVGLLGSAWAAAEPARREAITTRVRAAGSSLETTPSLRFVLTWESDANDVDLHVRDAEGHHAFFQERTLPTGGELYADVTTGYGPECFGIVAPADKRSPRYSLQVHYYSRGPMGYGMGKVEIVEHDGRGGLSFDERPFVVMNDRAYVDLGDWPTSGRPRPEH